MAQASGPLDSISGRREVEVNRRTAFRRFPEITTERLVLRQPTMKDMGWYYEYFSRHENVWGTGQQGPKDLKAAEKEFRRYLTDLYRERRGFRWIITLKGDDRPIGSLGYYKWLPSASYQAEMGYDLAREHWGKGIMTEAMRAVVDFGFERMGLNRIEVYIMPRNKRSIRMIKGLGFVREGLLRERFFDEHGNYADDVLFSMLKRDWMGRTWR